MCLEEKPEQMQGDVLNEACPSTFVSVSESLLSLKMLCLGIKRNHMFSFAKMRLSVIKCEKGEKEQKLGLQMINSERSQELSVITECEKGL